jgi:cellulose synthase/poly-beta-1,6-N-acetylglucosamine synthase-like glycosyltransferase
LVGEDQSGGPRGLARTFVHAERDLFVHEAETGLRRRMPELSASRVITQEQAIALAALALLALGGLAASPDLALLVVVALSSLSFLAGTGFRAVLAFLGGERILRPPTNADTKLPIYTILVPLYREANVLPRLARELAQLDYPRLDIKLIVEADDDDTADVADAVAKEGPFEVVRVPSGWPRTKPRACNYALLLARGEFTVIYDAEDRPERDQLRKAVARFRGSDDTLACLQARLSFYNAEEGWIPRLFTLDYMIWFGSLLPGLDRIGVPMPLGGTSNHFRTAVLRNVGGWDPYNVTEDADLGIRIAQLGKRVAMLDSTTFEEAPMRLDAWLKQRSRWLKGYMQTWLVHTRDPFDLWRRVGPLGFFAFHLFVGGAVLSALFSPVLWLTFVLSLVFGWHLPGGPLTDSLMLISGGGLLGGNAILTALAVIGPLRGGRDSLAPYGLTVTFYWLLISLAACRALHQLAFNPHHWDKTEHGLSRFSKP